MILKNIKPYLASHLRGHVNTVDEIVRLGHQLERDHEQQQQCETKITSKIRSMSPKRTSTTPPIVQCWRCKEFHNPGNCSHYATSNQPSQSTQSSYQPSQPHANRRTHYPHKPSSNAVSSISEKNSTTKQNNTTNSPRASFSGNSTCIPQQLIVPLSLGSWQGKAIVDTGASYTLIHESLWKSLTPVHPELQPWTRGPLYLANGNAEVPLGWANLEIYLHNQTFTMPAAVLPTHALAYAIVLGLDFIFFSGLQLKVIDQKYSFKIAPTDEYPFQPGDASRPPIIGSLPKHTKPTFSLMTSVPPPASLPILQAPDDLTLIKNAVDSAHLSPDGKQTLHCILSNNLQVCTLTPGRTNILQHNIYTTCQKDTDLPCSVVNIWEEQQRDPEVTKLLQALAENQDLEKQELCENWSITPKLTTAYHPQTNLTERVNRNLKNMMTAYVEDNHKKWDHYLPEFRFALNSATQETTGLSPAELQLGRKLQGPMDKILQDNTLTPDADAYDVVHHLHQLQLQAKENSQKAKKRQLRNYNKNRREVTFKEKDRVWLRNFPQSSAQRNFSAKLAPKWKGPYRVLQQLGPLNYKIVLEDTGEDIRTAHVCNLKICYPTAEELEIQGKEKLHKLFQDSSEEDEEFLGF
ncbi:hypothetical protein QQF64_023367 [Cirrhinus molitorella]|uniref:Peptidase A2 domain-containing protein n=1 Tax=Cirrhinus molitorella TaxID=172907 RepID=A0ABR3L7K8_9TELE